MEAKSREVEEGCEATKREALYHENLCYYATLLAQVLLIRFGRSNDQPFILSMYV